MIRDYPDVVQAPGTNTPSPLSSPSPTASFITSPPPSPLPGSTHLPPPVRTGPIPPPPRHPAALGPQTTYTPYIPRSKRATATQPNPLSATGQPVPIITSSSHGGVTTRHPPPAAKPEGVGVNGAAAGRYDVGPSAALLDKVRALDTLPRLGALRTLDLRGNDLRVSRVRAYIMSRVADGHVLAFLDWGDIPRPSAQTESNTQGTQFERE